jgi:hypothetical protein
MIFRKIVATIVVAAIFFWAPSVIPARAVIVGCGSISWNSSDTAFAAAPVVPCIPGPKTPWAVVGIGLSAFSVILNAIIVSKTQCRELTQQEAFNSLGLPFIGMAFNTKNNKCHH